MVFVVGAFTPGQFGGFLMGAGGLAAVLAMVEWRLPDFEGAARTLRDKLFRDPRLESWPRLQGFLGRFAGQRQ